MNGPENVNEKLEALPPYSCPNYVATAPPPMYAETCPSPLNINFNPNLSTSVNVNVNLTGDNTSEASIYDILKDKNHLMIKQNISIFKIFGIQCNNIYDIEEINVNNKDGTHLFKAQETSNIFKLNFGGTQRNFEMLCRQPNGSTILEFYRGRSCWDDFCRTSLFDKCRDEVLMNVQSKGRHIGCICIECCGASLCKQLLVKNSRGGPAYKLGKPCNCDICSCFGFGCFSCCLEDKLPILDATGTNQVGEIVRKRGTILREIFTDSNDFYIKFPENADPEIKGVLIGAVILWDFENFERNPYLIYVLALILILSCLI